LLERRALWRKRQIEVLQLASEIGTQLEDRLDES
jgi:hypothetical protein